MIPVWRALPLLLAAVLAQEVSAQSAELLLSSTTFRCNLTVGAVGDLDGDTPKATVTSDALELIFDQINAEKGTGRLVGNHGASDVTVIAGTYALTILEVLASGLMQVTVIYSAQTSAREFKVVHSRHPFFMGQPVPSQYYGSCRRLE